MIRHSVLAAMLLLVAFTAVGQPLSDDAVTQAAARIRPESFRAEMRFLADDALEGREANTRGYRAAAAYMASQLEALGLEPGASGSYFQRVPLRASRVIGNESSAEIVYGDRRESLVPGADVIFAVNYFAKELSIDAPVAFVGYGVTAPEFGYDDYAGIDVRGKVVVTLKGAPWSLPNDPRAFFSSTLNKAQNAAAHGAVGILRLQTPEDWEASPLQKSIDLAEEWGMHWTDGGKVADAVEVIRLQALLTPEGAEKLFARSKTPLSRIFTDAKARKLRSFDLPGRLRAEQHNEIQETESLNVAAVLPGSDPGLRSEFVVYTAHLDHLGVGAQMNGDAIYNGAYDNASGCAALIEVARAFTALPRRPSRSILFLAVTAEEKGLQGADYFVHHPTVPLDSIVANLNLDMFLAIFPTLDVVAFGAEHSSLGPLVERLAPRAGFKVSPDFAPEEVIFIRSDQFPFVKQGIPALFITSGIESGDPAINGRKAVGEWIRGTYHTRGDDMSQPIDVDSLVRFARLNFLIGYSVATAAGRPTWNEGDFFGRKFGRQ